ncbi:HpcH/HpaI aldolase/citrate lyase family protein [Paecilomyces variotii No. 5]|uniref:HpcH/HpaI aldolase/citrate lyase family protein n=1 Tax=Byssochlamys spectabilis (strain No. 5 / NBRC 109023) TaxID=1356009 RepID=V5GBU2_BYSSN|nr:HpcH/HpaI aldolase/citrate lyase family protein [Paecilomyces variotii No. 5]
MAMQATNRLQKALRTDRGLSFGAWQMLPGANHARLMARSGYDWICVDTEHGNIADWQMHEAVAAIAATGVSPIVRIAANEGWMERWILARMALLSLFYIQQMTPEGWLNRPSSPPVGRRGFGSPFAMGSTGNVTGVEYLQQANDALLTIVQIETKEALDNVEEIAKVPGIDVLFVGPWDLGNNIGRPVLGAFHDDLSAAIERIRKAAADAGKRSGIYCVGGEAAKKYADQGFHMISVVADAVALPSYLSNALETAQGGKSGATVPTY